MKIKCPNCESENIEGLEFEMDIYEPYCYCKCNECKQGFVVYYEPYKTKREEDF